MLRISTLLLAARVLAASPPAPHPHPIPIPGGQAGIGFDDLRWAPGLHRLLVPAGRTGTLDLVDPVTHAVQPIQGFATSSTWGGGHRQSTTSADYGDGLLFAIDRTARRLTVIDPKTAHALAEAAVSAEPDYVRWVAPDHEVWVTEPGAEQIEVFTLGADHEPAATRTISVPGGPESLVVDPARGRAYTQRWRGGVVAIGLTSHAAQATWPNGCHGSRGLVLDGADGLLVAACSEGRAAVLDVAHGGKLVSSVTSGTGVDVIDWDPGRRHVYFPGSASGTMAILGLTGAGALSVLGTVPVPIGAHCVASDGDGHAFVCDPSEGRLLELDDPYPPTKK